MIQYLYLGRVAYDEALRLQAEIADLRYQSRVDNVLLLLEHPPVLTLGRNANRSNVLASDELLAQRGVTIHEINRGGDVTYHGPGQLIGYPIFDLRSLNNPNGGRLGPVDFVRMMEEALIRLCAVYGVRAGRIAGLTGVWCGLSDRPETLSKAVPPARKIGAIGIHVARGITSHGFAFNVTTDLRDFQLINPCGITDKPVTSLAREVPDPARLPILEAIAHEAARQFGHVFSQQMLAAESLEALRAPRPPRAEGAAGTRAGGVGEAAVGPTAGGRYGPSRSHARSRAACAMPLIALSAPEHTDCAIYNPAGPGRASRSRIAERTIHANRRHHAPDGRVDLRRAPLPAGSSSPATRSRKMNRSSRSPPTRSTRKSPLPSPASSAKSKSLKVPPSRSTRWSLCLQKTAPW